MEKEKILVVDDEKAILSLLKLAFSKKGYEVATAESAEEALKILKEEKFFVIFLDLNLAGMNGIELCKIIKRDLPVSMVFAITGYASLFELSECREAGFDDYFKKPVNISTLTKTAADAFERINRWKNG